MAITTILFDLGGTLLHFDFSPICTTLSERSGRPPGEVSAAIEERYREFCLGRMTGVQWHGHLSAELGLAMTYDEFRRVWSDIFRPFESMIALARRLRPRYGQYLLSNTDEIHLPWCVEHFSLAPLLDGMILSYEIGAMKPDARIFDEGLRRAGLRPEECVFIDDLAANVEGARACGIDAVVCRSAEQVAHDLAAKGVGA